ncbi:hypothetical protein GTG28_18555 [Vibrio sp. OCN044]|uniref:Uncharacterized protein n=1 Tax=Vibrio tetraodonis subsp. pristinus TaxID=2695891 RepID=A0A6L8LYK6_9VIBR|nr:hypothetical protein [Vibrio tetraodonis]MYM61224.1 hypothetical protein [Vibrio tetraodonis subsp. pristinus]
MKKTILSIFASLLLIPSLAMASDSTLDKLSKSSAVNNELANRFLIHIKFVKSDFSNGFHNVYELKTQAMDSPNYYCATLKIDEIGNSGVEVVNSVRCAQ